MTRVPAEGGVPTPAGGRVARVTPGSPAASAGVRSGDVIVSADGQPMTDVLAWRWAASEDSVALSVTSSDGGSRHVALERAPGQEWGIEFVEALFDTVRTCENACSFCFVTQLPPGLRASLYVRDDDYRLSFLSGNFITLTNVTDGDAARIVEHRLKPLYVSLHAVTPSARESLVCARGRDTALGTLDRLLDGGIEVHIQIVLVPGVNEAEELDRTLEYLSTRPGVVSVGVVPLGWTRHQSRFARSFEAAEDAAAVLDRVEPWRDRMRGERGVRWVHAADEVYLNARRDVPRADEYDGFPQYDNGIGLVRSFLDDLAERSEEVEAIAEAWIGAPVPLVTGELFAPRLERAIADAHLANAVRALPVDNALFGGNVSVTGLLGGVDIADAIGRDGDEGPYLVPDIVLNADGVCLDDITVDEIAKRSGSPVRLVSSDATGLVEGLTSVLERREAR